MNLRPATPDDLEFLGTLAGDPEVEPFLAPGAGEDDALGLVLDRMTSGEEPHGLIVVESPTGRPVGALELALISRHSRICAVRRLMVDPASRGRGVGSTAVWLVCRQAFEDHGHHRVQAEVYGDNLASQRLFERLGFIREGVRRSAYWRRDQWLDGIIFGLLAGELVAPVADAGSA